MIPFKYVPESAMDMAKKVPVNQHQTGVARPPEANGVAIVAGTIHLSVGSRHLRKSD